MSDFIFNYQKSQMSEKEIYDNLLNTATNTTLMEFCECVFPNESDKNYLTNKFTKMSYNLRQWVSIDPGFYKIVRYTDQCTQNVFDNGCQSIQVFTKLSDP
jgi:hypothetical protein